MLTEQQKQEIIQDSFEKIKETVIEQATKDASWQITQATTGVVKEIVEKFVKEEIAPVIIVNLKEKQSVIIEAAILAAEDMSLQLAKGLTDTLSENLATSYKRKKIFEAMFD